MTVAPTLKRIEAQTASGQRVMELKNVPEDATVRELIEDLLDQMNLPQTDTGGRPLPYHARLEREGRHLHASEIVGDALKEDDRIMLQPDIEAGAALS